MGLLQDYLNRQRVLEDRATTNAALPGLLGTQGWEQSGPFQPGSTGALLQEQRGTGPMVGGSGLLGGEGMMDPTNRAKFSAGLMALPGMEGYGAQMMGQQFAGNDHYNQAAMAQGFQNQRFAADQARQMQEFQAQQALKQQQQQNPWADPSKLAPEIRAQSSAFMKQAQPLREQVDRFNSLTNQIQQVGGFNNMNQAQDLSLLTTFNKGIRPTEAQMADDVALILNNLGIPNAIERAKQFAKGEGMLPPEARKYLYESTQANANQQLQTLGNLRQQTQAGLAQSGLSPYEQAIMPPQQQLAQMGQGAASPAGQINRGGTPGQGGLLTAQPANQNPMNPDMEKKLDEKVPGFSKRATLPDGSKSMANNYEPIPYDASPTGWAQYDDKGNLIVFEPKK